MNTKPSPLSPKREAFAQGIASGKNATRSYIEAGYSENGADGAACKLQGIASIAARIEELRKENEKSMNMTRTEWLNAIQKRAISLHAEHPSATRYFDMLGKAQGWYDYEKYSKENSSKFSDTITFNLNRREPIGSVATSSTPMNDEDEDISDIFTGILPL